MFAIFVMINLLFFSNLLPDVDHLHDAGLQDRNLESLLSLKQEFVSEPICKGTLKNRVSILRDKINPKNSLSKKNNNCFLFYGPPSVGKRTASKLLAFDLNADLYVISPSNFMKWPFDKPRGYIQFDLLKSFINKLRNSHRRCILLINHFEDFLYFNSDKVEQYNEIFNFLEQEIDRSNNLTNNNLIIIGMTFRESNEVNIHDLFNWEKIKFDNPDEVTRQELFLLCAQEQQIPMSPLLAKKLASKTEGYAIDSFKSILNNAKKRSNGLVAEGDLLFACNQYASTMYRGRVSSIKVENNTSKTPNWVTQFRAKAHNFIRHRFFKRVAIATTTLVIVFLIAAKLIFSRSSKKQ